MLSDEKWDNLKLENYLNYISSIIEKRGKFNITADQCYEVHHIHLRSFGGLPEKTHHKSKHENLVWLTLAEHYEAHRILALDNLDNYKVVYAFMMMSTRKDGSVVENKEDYTKIREAFIRHDKQINTGKPSPNKGKHFDDNFKKLVSEKTKEALSRPEVKQKMSEANSGRIPWNKGKTDIYSEETKAKQSAAKKGKKLSEEHCKHISECQIGKIVSDETKQKIRAAQSGENCTHNKAIYCVELDKEFYNIKSAAEELNINGSNIVQACKGKRRTVGGMHFKYIEFSGES